MKFIDVVIIELTLNTRKKYDRLILLQASISKRDKNMGNIVRIFFRIPFSFILSRLSILFVIRETPGILRVRLQFGTRFLPRSNINWRSLWKRRDVQIMRVLRKRQANDSTLFSHWITFDFFGRNYISLHTLKLITLL